MFRLTAFGNANKFPIVFLVVALFVLSCAFASDHADPIKLKRLEAGITGLFVFPKDDQLIVILGVRRALTNPPDNLEPYTYSIYMDLHSKVSFENAEDRARYGGTIKSSQGIAPDITIDIRLKNDASLNGDPKFQGLTNADKIRVWTGVRDDPFIFPRFFGTNIVAMVLSIPVASFPEGQQDWLLWATSKRGGKQIDHVGRANRTMLPRFDFLNTLPPSKHVAAIRERHDNPGLLQDIARNEIMPLFAIRQYDFAPDVMIFTKRFPAGFPNGRRLTDDVAALTCKQGDCLLWELSFADSEQWPRQTINDKPFLDEFPYLAEPWPDKEPSPAPGLTSKNKTIFILLIALLVGLFITPWVLWIRSRRKLAKLAKASN